MRILLFTGKGGSGTSTAAAATAHSAAKRGHRTLLLVRPDDHASADLLGAPPDARPTFVAEQLAVARSSNLPGDVGAWDVVVVDGGPSATFLAWFERERGHEPDRSRADTLVARANEEATSWSVPSAREVLSDPTRTTARLVTTDSPLVLADTRRTLVALSLVGCPVDTVLWRGNRSPEDHLPITSVPPVRVVPHHDPEPTGHDALRALGDDMWGNDDPTTVLVGHTPLRVGRVTDGYELALDLPLVERDELDLARSTNRLVVRVAGWERTVPLPDSLARRSVRQATLREGVLRVHFADPDR